MRHINIPIFIPHLGCPNNCVFCNQHTISGVESFDISDVIRKIESTLSTIPHDSDVEIAFFGGSFTGIDRELMFELLGIGYSYIQNGRVKALRCSTRPDYVDEEIISILKAYGVKTVELGLQSCSNEVLEATKRGHYFEAEERACRLIVENGLNLVGQMMIGLPMSDIQSEIETAKFICSVGAVEARIYPTVVFRDTELCDMTANGLYTPLTIEEAVTRSAEVLEIFIEKKVEVIRIGLQATEGLSSAETYFAGPNHSALGELVFSELYYKKITKALSQASPACDDKIKVLISRGSLSKAIGQRRANILRLNERYKNISFAESDEILPYEISLQITNGETKCI